MNRLKNLFQLIAVLVALVLLFSQLPLGTAFQFSSDEGFEVIKPFLLNQGHALYKDIWDDQPPLFTLSLAAAFKMFGSSMLTARLVAVVFGLILFFSFHELVRQRSGRWCALISTFFLLASPGILRLSVSVMQEVP